MSFLPFNLLGAIPDILMGRDPKQALLGNAAAVTSTLAMPGILNQPGGLLGNIQAAGKYGTDLGSQQTAMLASQDAGMGNGLLDTATKYAKPIGTVMNAVNASRPPEQPMIPPPQPMPPTANPVLGQLVAQNQQMDANRMQEDQMRRDQMRQRIQAMRGY